jgi:hypothetical protein
VFTRMATMLTALSTAAVVRDHVFAAAPGSFLRLGPVEVAVLEVLRDPGAIEATPRDTRARLMELIETGAVRATLLADEIAEEHHVGARNRWRELELVVWP